MTAISGNNGNRRRRRALAADPRIQDAVMEEVRLGGTSAPKVHAALVALFGDARVPAVRTIRDMIREIQKRDTSEPWTIGAAEPDEIAIIAPVWGYGFQQGRALTVSQAEWVMRIRAAAPDLIADDVYTLAGRYAMSDGPIRWIDALLAFRPWADGEHRERYFKAANAGRIPAPPSALTIACHQLAVGDFGAAGIPEILLDDTAGPETRAFALRVVEWVKAGEKVVTTSKKVKNGK